MAGGDLLTLVHESGLGVLAAAIEDGAGFKAWVSDLVETIGDAGVPAPSPAIGVGPLGRAGDAAVDPWSVVSALLEVATSQATASPSRDDGEDLARIATAMAAIAAATTPLAAVDWESRQQALAARATLSAAIGAVAAAVIAGDDTATATTRRQSWRALGALRRAVHQDLDDRIGRLPSVMTVTV